MKKVVYIPGQKKECYFDKGTLDIEQQKKLLKNNEKLRAILTK